MTYLSKHLSKFTRIATIVRPKVFLVVFTLFSSLISTKSIAQIYQPDGVRMPGTWNGWSNITGMGGPFDLQAINQGTLRWQTSFQYTGASGVQEFKFVSTAFGDPWGNQWAGNISVTLNNLNLFTYGTPSDPNNKISLNSGKWYTVVFEDKGYVSTRAIFMETSAQPVEISTVSRQPLLVDTGQQVTITATLSSTPSPEEKFFLRFTTDDWATSSQVPMNVNATSASAPIPAFSEGTTVKYYVYSSTLSNPSADFDLVSLRINSNNGQFYTYTVGEGIQCGPAIDVVYTDPAFPQEGQPVMVYFNAEFGNGGLFNYTGDVFAHTGVITNLSTQPSDWRYVKTEWGQNTPETKMTRLGENLYSLQIDDIRAYYGVPASETILKMAFVFRGGETASWGGYPEHKNADGSDIFVKVYQPQLNVKILSPSPRNPLASPDEILAVCVEALLNDSIFLYLNNALLTSAAGNNLAYPLELQGYAPGTYWIKAIAKVGSSIIADSVSIYLRGPVQVADLPVGTKPGINYIDNQTVTLVLHDPPAKKQFAFAIGDFSNWKPNDQTYMKRTPDGKYYWVTLTGIQPGKEYAFQYFIDGKLKIADPYADKILDPWNDKWIPSSNYPNLKAYPFDLTTGVVSILQTNRQPYNWIVNNFVPPAVHSTQSDLLIYELLIRDFTDEKTFKAAMEKLDYLASLGVNAIELMPVMEFDGNESWGYAPNFFFAPDKYYGTANDLKAFIDAAHQRGIAVIMDIVTNHAFGLCPLVQMYFDEDKPASDNPWFNPQATHPLSVGYDFNHESVYTRQFIKDVLTYWLTEYKFDGFRFDLSKGLTQKYTGNDLAAWSAYDQSRINILTDYYNHIKSVNPNAYMILEHFANNDEEVVLANTGMLLWSGMHDQYKQVGIGWTENSNLSWAYHGNRGFTYPNLVDYMENHDEERIMAEALQWGNTAAGYNLKDTLTAVKHQQQATALFMGIPGPKMVWQFAEMGYDYSILFGGERTANKPPRWDYLNSYERERLTRIYAAMANLRKRDAFRYGTFTSDLSGTGKRMWISHSSLNVSIAANMGVTGFDMAPGFAHAGTWYDYFTGQTINVTDPAGQTFWFGPGDYRVFTDQPLPRPFYDLTALVLDAGTGLPLDNVRISLTPAGSRLTGPNGTASFTLLPGIATLTLNKEGYLPKDTTWHVDKDASIVLKMAKGPNAVPDITETRIKVFPQPATYKLIIEGGHSYNLTLIAMDGKIINQVFISSPIYQINTTNLPRGTYILRFKKNNEIYFYKIVIIK
ncbi:MAG: T9SS type A sorting domain-containing protein [Bacteroidales bacterium]|jgi:1,4-alpha-glucan branching enzyme|nr:T9SS type A sorting domain-containing protein [Bacteroidales bacterium]